MVARGCTLQNVTPVIKKNTHFWEIVKPFMTNKIKSSHQTITLYENGTLVSNQSDVSNIFKYFINVAHDMSEPENVNKMSADQVINHYKDHPSIKLINDHAKTNQQFNFTHISQTVTKKKLKFLPTNKASCFDNISPKFLKVGSHSLSHSLTPIINNSIASCIFPDHNKRADVSPHTFPEVFDVLVTC